MKLFTVAVLAFFGVNAVKLNQEPVQELMELNKVDEEPSADNLVEMADDSSLDNYRSFNLICGDKWIKGFRGYFNKIKWAIKKV